MQPLVGQWASGGIEVSILTRAFARVQPVSRVDVPRHRCDVSILTRAFARVQLFLQTGDIRPLFSFNPHSSFRPSATAPRPAIFPPILHVSILTRAFARVQPQSPRGHGQDAPSFNPHSSFRPSATLLRPNLVGRTRFNPHSSFRPSATWPVEVESRTRKCFNPHSSFRPSATIRSSA